jgi:hypothetical protein
MKKILSILLCSILIFSSSMLVFAEDNNEENVVAEETTTSSSDEVMVILRGNVQDKFAATCNPISYVFYNDLGDSEGISDAATGYINNSQDYQTVVMLPKNQKYTISFLVTVIGDTWYMGYSNYSEVPFETTDTIYIDFIYGDENFIAENSANLLTGVEEHINYINQQQEEEIDTSESKIVEYNKEDKATSNFTFNNIFIAIGIFFILIIIFIVIVIVIKRNKE